MIKKLLVLSLVSALSVKTLAQEKPAAAPTGAQAVEMMRALMQAVLDSLKEIKASDGQITAVQKLFDEFKVDLAKYYKEHDADLAALRKQIEEATQKAREISAKAPQISDLFKAMSNELDADQITKLQGIMEEKRGELEKKYGRAFAAKPSARKTAPEDYLKPAQSADPRLDARQVYQSMNLTAEQNQKIQGFGEEFKEQYAEFLKKNSDDLKRLGEELKAAYAAKDPLAIQSAGQNLKELMKRGPDDIHEKIMSILTPEQQEKYAPLAEQLKRDGGLKLLRGVGVELPKP